MSASTRWIGSKLWNVSTTNGWVAIHFGPEIHVPHRMHCDYIGDSLTFHLADLAPSGSHLWSMMWTWPLLCPVVLQEQPPPIHHRAGEPRGLLASSAAGDWWLHPAGCWQVSMAATEALNPPSNHSLRHCMNFKAICGKHPIPENSSHHCQLLSCSYDKHIQTHTTTHTVLFLLKSKEVSVSHVATTSEGRLIQANTVRFGLYWMFLSTHYMLYIFFRNEPAHITMLAPFLQYLYCEPQRQPQYALLRHSLLRVLLPIRPGAGSILQNKDQTQDSAVSDSLLHCLCQLVPHMQVTCFFQSAFRQ